MGLNWNKTIFWTILLSFGFFAAGWFAELSGNRIFLQEFFSAKAIVVLVVFMFTNIALGFVE